MMTELYASNDNDATVCLLCEAICGAIWLPIKYSVRRERKKKNGAQRGFVQLTHNLASFNG